MSDPQSYGDPVDEPQDDAHDVVGRAHEGLADAEAARRDAVDPAAAEAAWEEREASERSAAAPVMHTGSTGEAAVVHDASPRQPEPAASSALDLDDEDARWAAYAASAEPETAPREPVDPAVAAPVVAGAAAAAATPRVDEPAAYGSEPLRASSGAQPIFVQAPEAPRPRGNRGAAGAIGLLAALVFAVLNLAAILGLALVTNRIGFADVPQTALDALTTWMLWVPTVAFFFGFWFLGAIINRGRWGHWVVWGLIVGVVAWAGHLLAALFSAPFWMITAREGVDLLERNLLAPLAIVSFVLGRELTIWFGAWVARRGRRVTELNDEAQREYERTLEAGPQLAR